MSTIPKPQPFGSPAVISISDDEDDDGMVCCAACRSLCRQEQCLWADEASARRTTELEKSSDALNLLSFQSLDKDSAETRQTRQCCAATDTYTICQVRRHNTVDSAWIVAGRDIYDVTSYVHSHPGGTKSILSRAGGARDCTRDFKFHSKKGQKAWEHLKIGRLVECGGSSNNFSSEKRSPWWMLNWNQ